MKNTPRNCFVVLLLLLATIHPASTQISTPVATNDQDADATNFGRLALEFQGIQARVRQAGLTLFANPLEVTIFHINEIRRALYSFAFIIPTEDLAEVGPAVLEAVAMPPKKNAIYWTTLASALRHTGYIESGRSSGISLMAKSFPENLPNDLYLVMNGTYRGFFTLSNGDKFIPGIQFYEKLLDHTIQYTNFPYVNVHFSDRLADANKLATAGKRQEALIAYKDFLKDPKAPDVQIAIAYYNTGAIYADSIRSSPEGPNLGLAEDAFTQAIRHNPEFATAYLQRSIIFDAKDQYDAALRDCIAALRYSKDPKEIQTLQKLKSIIERQVQVGR